MTAMEKPKGSRWQLIAASVLLAVWVAFLGWMALRG
jgi:hypothetical protein